MSLKKKNRIISIIWIIMTIGIQTHTHTNVISPYIIVVYSPRRRSPVNREGCAGCAFEGTEFVSTASLKNIIVLELIGMFAITIADEFVSRVRATIHCSSSLAGRYSYFCFAVENIKTVHKSALFNKICINV